MSTQVCVEAFFPAGGSTITLDVPIILLEGPFAGIMFYVISILLCTLSLYTDLDDDFSTPNPSVLALSQSQTVACANVGIIDDMNYEGPGHSFSASIGHISRSNIPIWGDITIGIIDDGECLKTINSAP